MFISKHRSVGLGFSVVLNLYKCCAVHILCQLAFIAQHYIFEVFHVMTTRSFFLTSVWFPIAWIYSDYLPSPTSVNIWVVSNICNCKQYCGEHLCACEWDLLEMEFLDDSVCQSSLLLPTVKFVCKVARPPELNQNFHSLKVLS